MKSAQTLKWWLAGIVFIVIGIPPIFEKIPPNPWYGFRVAKTFSDERIWYAANRVMGYDMLIAGLVILIGAIVVAKFIRGNPRLANQICFSVFLFSLVTALAHGFWALSRM